MRLTYDDKKNELEPRWSPDGLQIAYAKTNATPFERVGAEDTIHFVAVDGSGETRESMSGGYPSFDAEWKYITFVRTMPDTGRDIYYMPMDGSEEPKAIVATKAMEWQSVLSPDGKWLIYTTNETGVQQAYVTRFPSGQGKWQVSRHEIEMPRWSPDGKRIYYVGPEVGLYEVEFNTQPRVMLSPPRLVVDSFINGIDPYIGLDFSEDQQSLIAVKTQGGSRKHSIGVIENWYEEYQHRVD